MRLPAGGRQGGMTRFVTGGGRAAFLALLTVFLGWVFVMTGMTGTTVMMQRKISDQSRQAATISCLQAERGANEF